MSRAEEYAAEKREINGTPVTVTTYRVEDIWHCTIANVDPGANIARADASSRDEAVAAALDKATRRVEYHSQSRRSVTTDHRPNMTN